MAKIRPAKGKKATAKSARNAVPCLVVIVLGIVLFTLLFYAVLKSS